MQNRSKPSSEKTKDVRANGNRNMHLVELFLPLATNEGSPFTRPVFASVEKELTELFGGATAYPRAPASGIWKQNGEVQNEMTWLSMRS